jgi:hypothetical protein
MTSEKIKDILTELGYKLSDFGNHWRTNALYRGGKNPSALQIYKDSGVWIDYVKNSEHMSLRSLIEATLKTNDKVLIDKFTKGYDFSTERKEPEIDIKPKVEMEKTYPNSILKKLLPHYKFYNDRGISDNYLISLGSGLATEGSMYQRFVFPIYNSNQKIYGFSGRDMAKSKKDSRPKWKHLGKKSNWIYPYYSPNVKNIIHESIMEKESVILVESIGDMLNLFQYGIYNVLVTFGTIISSSLVLFLTSFPSLRVIISLNNDSDKEVNRGRVGSFKSALKLLSFFDISNIVLYPPTEKDFGDMSEKSFWPWINNLETCYDTNSLIKYKQEILGLIDKNLIPKSSFKQKYFNA